jgi:hypothetical protein
MMKENRRPILDRELAARAFDRIRTALETMLQEAFTGRAGFAVVVTTLDEIAQRKAAESFRESCLLVTSVGDLTASSYPNLEIALSKAEISARTRLPTSQLPPHYYYKGDTVYAGSAILEGIVVACAGLEPRDDEMISCWIAAAVKSEAALAISQLLAGDPSADFFADA